MTRRYVWFGCLALFGASAVWPQITLNPLPSRTAGHPKTPILEQNQLYSAAPNLVEGRELYQPQGIAVDTTVSPSPLYVADTGNNRVLGWKDADGFTSGQKADIVIGQSDFHTTWPEGPNTAPRAPGAGAAIQSGLSYPTGLAALNGDLYVVDSGNNRVLRYPRPFENADHIPDLVIGQPDFSHSSANYGGKVSAQGLSLSSGTTVYSGGIACDAQGDLWVSDPGNKRVLKFAQADMAAGGGGLTAVLVLGQNDFTSLRTTSPTQTGLEQFAGPGALAFDSGGRLYVADASPSQPQNLSRVLVFLPPFSNSKPATSILGISSGQTTVERAATTFNDPAGIFFFPGTQNVGVLDSGDHRILIFPSYINWPLSGAASSAQALTVVGHDSDFTNFNPNNRPSSAAFTPAPSASVFYSPSAAALAGGQLYVADALNNRVLAMPLAGNSVGPATRVLGQDRMDTGSPNLVEGREFQFVYSGYRDAGLAIDSLSETPHLFVADTYNHRVLGFKDTRKVAAGAAADIVIGQENGQTALCNYPTGDPGKPTDSSLCSPVGVLVDSQHNLWVADRGNGRVLRFPDPFAQNGLPKADLVLGQANFTAPRVADATAGTMSAPYGLAMTVGGTLAISDQNLNRVLVFQPSNGAFTNGQAASKVIGQRDFHSTASGTSLPALSSPHHIAIDMDSRLYVTDTVNNRVLIYDRLDNPQFPAAGASAAISLTGFNSPQGIYVNPATGEVWIADVNNGVYKRYPEYLSLITNAASTGTITAGSTPYSFALAVAQDRFGALVTADGTNRVGFYYPSMVTENLANGLGVRLAPGAIASVTPANAAIPFGSAGTVSAAEVPLPTCVSDLQVLFDGVAAPLFMVSPQQVNFQVPVSARTGAWADVEVVNTSTGQVYGAGMALVDLVSPGVFLNPDIHTGSEQIKHAAVVNVNDDGTRTPNGPEHPAKRNSWIEIYGTGQGIVPGGPASGEAAPGALSTPFRPIVTLNGISVDDGTRTLEPDIDHIYYSGLAPGLVGVWQINVRIPNSTTPGIFPGLTGSQVDLAIIVNSIPSYDYKVYRTVISVR